MMTDIYVSKAALVGITVSITVTVAVCASAIFVRFRSIKRELALALRQHRDALAHIANMERKARALPPQQLVTGPTPAKAPARKKANDKRAQP